MKGAFRAASFFLQMNRWATPSVLAGSLAISLFRMLVGAMWIHQAYQKAPWKEFGWLRSFMLKEIENPTFEFYRNLLEEVALPNFELVGYSTFFLELALGICLLVGFLIPLASGAGALWTINIAMGAFSVPGEWPWTWPLLFMPHLVFLTSGRGRWLSIDRLLSPTVSGPLGSA